MAEWICKSCVNYPPSSSDGKPCTMCDTDDVLLSAYSERDDKEFYKDLLMEQQEQM